MKTQHLKTKKLQPYPCGAQGGDLAKLLTDLQFEKADGSPSNFNLKAGDLLKILPASSPKSSVIWLRRQDGAIYAWQDDILLESVELIPASKTTAKQKVASVSL